MTKSSILTAMKIALTMLCGGLLLGVGCGGDDEPDSCVESDDQIDADIRQRAETIYHPVGTCRMGSDEKAVVDVRLRVNGVRGLRVADASIMPTMPSANTNAATIMIGEKCADFIRGHQLAPTDLSGS